MNLQGKNIVLAVSGSIAAYKAAELASRLMKAGAAVRVAMTSGAAEFIAPLTFEALTQHPVYSAVFNQPQAFEMEHITWAKWADALVIAPATADLIAKLAAGLGDDPVLSLYLSFSGPVVVAPAMNTVMYLHPATTANLQTLRTRGAVIVDPASGRLACGDIGPGKLADPETIIAAIEALPEAGGSPTQVSEAPFIPAGISGTTPVGPPDNTLSGKTIVITSGPTHEYIDPVRFLTNPSSGRMGAALAAEALRRGARVHFVSGPVGTVGLPPPGAVLHKVTTAEQMLQRVQQLAADADIFIFAAAVSDFRVPDPTSHKIKRTGNSLNLPLIENPDIAQAVGVTKRDNQVTVGFAAETNDMEKHALGKMERKRLDMIVANNVSNPRIGFESELNEVTIYMRDGSVRHVPEQPKITVAREILGAVVDALKEPEKAEAPA